MPYLFYRRGELLDNFFKAALHRLNRFGDAAKVGFMRYQQEGACMPPWWYGFAFTDVMSNRRIFYPLPFNWFVRWGRLLRWKWDCFRGLPPRYELIAQSDLKKLRGGDGWNGFAKGYARGFKTASDNGYELARSLGYREGYTAGRMDELLERKIPRKDIDHG